LLTCFNVKLDFRDNHISVILIFGELLRFEKAIFLLPFKIDLVWGPVSSQLGLVEVAINVIFPLSMKTGAA